MRIIQSAQPRSRDRDAKPWQVNLFSSFETVAPINRFREPWLREMAGGLGRRDLNRLKTQPMMPPQSRQAWTIDSAE
ncbi:hypothetical protein BY996DRAFT_6464733 [Phakopsora pachyrhizi]|nr:hypothetical protein BY996DRAFT_6464733 [Phakopsora pachyrhizi]